MSLFRSSREKAYWTVALTLVLGTWATLYWARPVSEWFRDRGLLMAVMFTIFGVTALGVLATVVRLRPNWKEIAVLGVFGLAYFFSIRPVMGRPEEALHFVQYGLIAGFLYAALLERRRHLEPWAPGMPVVDPEVGDSEVEPPEAPRVGAAAVAEPSPDPVGRAFLALPGMPAVLAFALAVLAGSIDEGIQWILPNRYFGLRDIGFNSAAAALAVAGMTCWRAARGPRSD